MKRILPSLTLILLLLVLGLSACGPAPADVVSASSGDVRPNFQDDFSNPSSGWDRYQDDQMITDYNNGSYRLRVDQSNKDIWSNPGQDFTDVQIDVDATRIGGPDKNDFGVICRYQDENNFYSLLITSDQYFAILKEKDGREVKLGSAEWKQSSAIQPGNAANHIQAKCLGDRLSLVVNGTLLLAVQDSDFLRGDVGLVAGTYETPGTDILFDHFIAVQP